MSCCITRRVPIQTNPVRYPGFQPGKKARMCSRCLCANNIHIAVKAAPPVVKAVLQVSSMIVGGTVGGFAGLVIEEEVITKRKGGLFAGLYGLLIGALLGSIVLSVCMALYLA